MENEAKQRSEQEPTLQQAASEAASTRVEAIRQLLLTRPFNPTQAIPNTGPADIDPHDINILQDAVRHMLFNIWTCFNQPAGWRQSEAWNSDDRIAQEAARAHNPVHENPASTIGSSRDGHSSQPVSRIDSTAAAQPSTGSLRFFNSGTSADDTLVIRNGGFYNGLRGDDKYLLTTAFSGIATIRDYGGENTIILAKGLSITGFTEGATLFGVVSMTSLTTDSGARLTIYQPALLLWQQGMTGKALDWAGFKAKVLQKPANITLTLDSDDLLTENIAADNAGTLAIDARGSWRFSLGSGGDAALFTISDDGVTLKLKPGTSLDYETKNMLTVPVTATDGTNTASTSLTIAVKNADESTPLAGGVAKNAHSPTKASQGNAVDWLLGGNFWTASIGKGIDVTYSFIRDGISNLSGAFKPVTLYTISDQLKQAVRKSLELFSEVSLVSFTEVTETNSQNGIIRIGASNDGDKQVAYAYLPNDSQDGGNIWLNGNDDHFNDASNLHPGNYFRTTITHEIGHALGLLHPQDNGGSSSTGGPDNALPWTIMAYAEYDGEPIGGSSNNKTKPTGLMINDIAAMQYIYGANMQHNAGDTTYTLSSFSNEGYLYASIWDAGGEDHFSWKDQKAAARISLKQGSFSSFGSISGPDDPDLALEVPDGSGLLGIGYGVTIEHATGGSADDQIIGNDADNQLDGGPGQDRLSGGKGDDLFILQLPANSTGKADVVADFGTGADRLRLPDRITHLWYDSQHKSATSHKDNSSALYDTVLYGGNATAKDDNSVIAVLEDFFSPLSSAMIDGQVRIHAVPVPNRPPIVQNPIADVTADKNTAISITIDNTIFTDPDGDSLTISVSGLPDWLSYNATTGIISGTTPNSNTTATLSVTATDPDGLSVTDSVLVRVGITPGRNGNELVLPATPYADADDAPQISNYDPITDRLANTSISSVTISNRLVGERADMLVQDVPTGANAKKTYLVLRGYGDYDAIEDYVLTLGFGTGNADTIDKSAETGSQYLRGYGGADIITGGTGDDLLFGEAGNDTLNGGRGRDYLVGGIGKDSMTGGTGSDIFALTEAVSNRSDADVITDFSFLAGDLIDLPNSVTDIWVDDSGDDAILLDAAKNGKTWAVLENSDGPTFWDFIDAVQVHSIGSGGYSSSANPWPVLCGCSICQGGDNTPAENNPALTAAAEIT